MNTEENQNEGFDYNEAMVRNLGLVTSEEQARLRQATVAIAGLGGAGGAYLVSLVRQGFEKFKIADIDSYELKNMNRQFGARPDTVGRPKIEVMREEALRINPNCQIESFSEGVTPDNIDAFFTNVDVAVDAIEIFEVETHRMFNMNAQRRGIPVLFGAPIGFGAVFIASLPDGPSFDTYFDITDETPYETALAKYLLGLMPSMLQRTYMSQNNVSLKDRRGPSSIASINICTGMVGINAVKIVLGRGVVKALPYYQQFDAMRNKYVLKRLRFGNRNPLQRLKLYIAKRKYGLQ